MTMIHCVLQDTAVTSKHQAGIVQGDRLVLYSEWDDLAAAVAERLRRAGVVPGERIGLFMANDWRLLVLLTGLFRAGAVACPLSTRLPRATVVEQLREIGARRVIAFLDASKGKDLGGLEVLSPEALLRTPDQASPGGFALGLDDPAVVVFTSGSGGRPRPAVLTYGNLYYNARGANANVRLASNDRWLLNLPLYHVSGLGVMMRSLLAGASVVIPEQEELLAASLMRYRPTHVSLVPAQLQPLLDDTTGQPFESLRVILLGGCACPAGLLERARVRHWPVMLTYGMTEAGSQITTMPPTAPPAKRWNTAGRALPHREVKVSEEGEILVRGPCVFAGYWREGGVEDARDAEGWFATGDRGVLDEEGYLTVLGRKDFMMISGGENIQPEEVELALCSLEGVEAAVVCPVDHPVHGQRPVAFVRAEAMRVQDWVVQLAAVLPKFKIPDAFYPWPEALLPTGLKPDRARLAAEAKTFQ